MTQADVNAGGVTNTATATGTPPTGPAVTSPPATVVLDIPAAPSLTLSKTADPVVDANGNGVIDAGDTIAYSFLITNTGNVTLTDVAVSDETVHPVSCPVTTLEPLESTTCTTTYTITQADVDAGAVLNTATATATPPPTAPQPVQPTDSTVTPIPALPAIELIKTADRTGLTVGDTITYSFTATNTGNVTLTNVQITEVIFSGSGTLSPPACDRTAPLVTLAPGEVITCTASYQVTQADVDTGMIHNAATITGTPPTGPDVSSAAELTLTQESQPALALTKRASVNDINHDGATNAGDEILYQFDVTNTGNVTLTGLEIHDATLAADGIAIVCPGTPLLPGQTVTCQAQAPHTVTAADVTNGVVHNSATATAVGPNDELVESAPQAVDVPINAMPSPKPPATALPVTGVSVRILWAAAMLLLAAGTAALLATRIRRRPTSRKANRPST